MLASSKSDEWPTKNCLFDYLSEIDTLLLFELNCLVSRKLGNSLVDFLTARITNVIHLFWSREEFNFCIKKKNWLFVNNSIQLPLFFSFYLFWLPMFFFRRIGNLVISAGCPCYLYVCLYQVNDSFRLVRIQRWFRWFQVFELTPNLISALIVWLQSPSSLEFLPIVQ